VQFGERQRTTPRPGRPWRYRQTRPPNNKAQSALPVAAVRLGRALALPVASEEVTGAALPAVNLDIVVTARSTGRGIE
jgi:hypothetical protein